MSCQPDVAMVYEDLLRASRNHLRAFCDQLRVRDGGCEPRHLGQETFDAIAGGSHERGRH